MQKRIYHLKGAYVFPATKQLPLSRSSWGVCSQDPKKDPIDFGYIINDKPFKSYKTLTNYKERKIHLTQKIVKPIKGTFLYLGPMLYVWGFGHFMAESTGRLWACRSYRGKIDGYLVLAFSTDLNLPEYVRSLFKYFSINPKKIHLVNDLSQVENLIVPESGNYLGYEKYWFASELKKFITPNLFYKKDLPKKIIIRKSRKYWGRLAGLSYFSSLLVKSDFEVIFPEEHSLEKQLSYIYSADVIVWEEGSACHILEIISHLKSFSILIKRRPLENPIDWLLKRKIKNLLIYNDVRMLKRRNNSYGVPGRFKCPIKFFNVLKRYRLIDAQTFNLNEFKVHEWIDVFTYFYFIPVDKIKKFFVISLKPYLPEYLWAALKNMNIFGDPDKIFVDSFRHSNLKKID